MHAIHIHEKADCASPDGKSAGGHWNPTFENHGQWGSEKGYHKGDIGNFTVDNNGVGAISMSTDQWCIGCDDPAKNILGKAVIIHQGEDDLTISTLWSCRSKSKLWWNYRIKTYRKAKNALHICKAFFYI